MARVEPALVEAAPLQPQDRVELLPVLGGQRLAVALRVALVVAAQPVGQALEQERALAASRASARKRAKASRTATTSLPSTVSRARPYGRDDVADALDDRVRRARRELGEAVVLADEDHRQPPERRPG